jgi:hypothetical protein
MLSKFRERLALQRDGMIRDVERASHLGIAISRRIDN